MELESPIGKIIKTGNTESQVIGVVKDFQYGSLHQAIVPLIFRFRDTWVGNNVLVKIKAGNERKVIKQIEGLYKKFHPKYPFEFTFLDDDYQSLYASEQRIGGLSKYFAALAILISCLGLFGLATFSAQKKQKEIAIRKIVGASWSSVFALLSKDFLKLVLISVAIASPVAWWAMNKWLQDFTYRIDIAWWIFIAAGLMALLIALITVSFQAIKAAIANPVQSLRTE
jgi:ABC-type antimicrobial peptide transport system permease subunit